MQIKVTKAIVKLLNPAEWDDFCEWVRETFAPGTEPIGDDLVAAVELWQETLTR